MHVIRLGEGHRLSGSRAATEPPATYVECNGRSPGEMRRSCIDSAIPAGTPGVHRGMPTSARPSRRTARKTEPGPGGSYGNAVSGIAGCRRVGSVGARICVALTRRYDAPARRGWRLRPDEARLEAANTARAPQGAREAEPSGRRPRVDRLRAIGSFRVSGGRGRHVVNSPGMAIGGVLRSAGRYFGTSGSLRAPSRHMDIS
jgi:hypothetical protein